VQPEDENFFLTLFGDPKPHRSPSAIALQISEAIAAGRLTLGQRLPNERDLGKIFGVSRATLREALRFLEADGLIEIRRGVTGGAYVSAPDIHRAASALTALVRFHQATPEHFAEFRLTFEAQNARLAAQRASSEQIATLLELAARVGVSARPEVPWEEFMDLDIAFHETVAEATANPIRLAVMLGVRNAFRQSSLDISRYDTPTWRTDQATELLDIAHAIRHRKATLAYDLMQHHLNANTAVAKAILSHAGGGAAGRS